MSAPRGDGGNGAGRATVTAVSPNDLKQSSIGGVRGEHYGSQYAGGAWKATHTNRMITAISDPVTYMADRAKQLDAVNVEIDDEFRVKYAKLLTNGVPPDDALRRAQSYIMKISTAKFADLDFDFPEDLQATAANLSYTRSKAGQNGFDPNVLKKEPKPKK